MAGPCASQPLRTRVAGAAMFLVLTLDAGAEGEARERLADVAGLVRSVGFRVPDGELSCVVGIGSTLWDRLFSGPRPVGLHPFREFVGSKHNALATPGDLLFHIPSPRRDLCFDPARPLGGPGSCRRRFCRRSCDSHS